MQPNIRMLSYSFLFISITIPMPMYQTDCQFDPTRCHSVEKKKTDDGDWLDSADRDWLGELNLTELDQVNLTNSQSDSTALFDLMCAWPNRGPMGPTGWTKKMPVSIKWFGDFSWSWLMTHRHNNSRYAEYENESCASTTKPIRSLLLKWFQI